MVDRPKSQPEPSSSSAAFATPASATAEAGLQSIDAVAAMTRQNVETMLTVAHGAVQGFEDMITELAAFSRDSFERAASAGRAMTAVTSPNELLQMQADYSRRQTEAAMAEMTKLSQVIIKTARESLAVSMDAAKPRGGDQ